MTAALRFRGGGSLDGLAWQPPYHPPPPAVVTITRDGGRSCYVLDDTAGAYQFTGFNEQGGAVGKIMRAFGAEARAEREAVEAAMRPVGCRACGATYGSPSAYQVHFESGEGSRCLPGDARGQLVDRDGVWCLPGSDTARR